MWNLPLRRYNRRHYSSKRPSGGIDIKTYNDIFLETRRQLRAGGIDGYDAEARLLAVAASGKTREHFLRDRHLYVPDEVYECAVNELVARRLSGEPVAYILGEWEFYGLPLNITRGVLIPRIDTEVLADTVIELYKKNLDGTRVLDLCTGTGCVGLAIASNVPFCRALLADISTDALRLCRSNILRNNLTRRVTSMELNAMEAPPMLLGLFDVIVCNPPYIPTADIATLDRTVRDFEPYEALDGGPDGLDFYRSVTRHWKTVLRERGRMAFECGIGQAADVADILRDNGFGDISIHKDTLGIERVVIGTLQD